MDLVINIGNFRIKGALFDGSRLHAPFDFPLDAEMVKSYLISKQIDQTLVASVNGPFEIKTKKIFEELSIPFQLLDFSTLKAILEVDEPEELGHDRIANIYGALFHFPQNNCIVVDLGTAVTFDFIGSNGHYLGGAIYPGLSISAKALNQYTDKLPEIAPKKPPSAIAKTTETHIQSGLYFGLLGAIERIVDEMRRLSPHPGDVKVLATGGHLRVLGEESLYADLSDIVDLIDPMLTIIGLHEIMKEKKSHVR